MNQQNSIQERFLGWLANSDPARRELILAGLFLLALLGAGTIGYRIIEGWPAMDALYMTFITLTTIGFTEVHSMGSAGRIFTIIIAVLGIGNVAFIATRTAQLLISNPRLRERHMNRRIGRLQDHFILCGYGRIGKRISEDLKRAGKPFLVIDRDADELDIEEDDRLLYVQGDAEEEDTLRKAGIEHARGIILTLPEDSANVFVTLMARELNPHLFILARANALRNRRKLLHAGADKVLSPDEIGADRMAQVILRPNVDRFMEQVLQTGAHGLQMEEVTVEAGAPLAGKSLAQSDFRRQFDAVVVAIIDAASNEMVYNPAAKTQLKEGDILIVLGSQAMISRLQNEGCRPELSD